MREGGSSKKCPGKLKSNGARNTGGALKQYETGSLGGAKGILQINDRERGEGGKGQGDKGEE